MSMHEDGDSTRKASIAYRLAGIALLLLLWQIAGRSGIGGKTLPAASDVLHIYTLHVRRALLLRAASATCFSAGLGLLLGTVLGCATAIVTQLLPALGLGLDRLAVVVNAVPAIALGPILIVTAGRQATPVLLAAIPVYFLIYVAATTGLRNSGARLKELFQVNGASEWRRFRYLDSVAAVPSLLSGLKVSITTAMIGAVVGEWFGAPTGLGIVILNTMQNFQVPLMWATVLVVAAITLSAYGLIGLIESAIARRLA